MQTELNEQVHEYLKKYKLEEITADTIKQHFPNINISNDYGNLLHALVHDKYDEEKVLKTIDLLLSLGINVNKKGENTGYTFIHLALYGYTDQNKDYSYSTEFMLKLIKMAKKYNFNVNATDKDKDTIIHTALASEVYSGKIIPLIQELGPEFDLKAKDNENKDIYEALLSYKEEVSSTKNDNWLNHLVSEEEEIKKLVEMSKYNLNDIEKELKTLKISLEELKSELSESTFINNYEAFVELETELKLLLERRKLFTEEQSIYQNISSDYIINFKLFINKYIKELTEKPILKEIDQLDKFLEKPIFEEELFVLLAIKQEYINKINSFKSQISSSTTLNQLNNLEKKLSHFCDDEIITTLSNMIVDGKQDFITIIANIQQTKNITQYISTWMKQHHFYNFNKPYNQEEKDYRELEKDTLEECLSEEEKTLADLKTEIKLKTSDFFQSFTPLIEKGIITKKEILDCFIETKDDTASVKIKVMSEETK